MAERSIVLTSKTFTSSGASAAKRPIAAMIDGDNWDRLVAVKRTHDPTNLFRLNQNIDPGA